MAAAPQADEAREPDPTPEAQTDDASPVAGEARHVALDVADNPDAKLTAALAAAQGEFPPISKNKTGKVEKNGTLVYSYTYADLGDVLTAVRPVLSKHGLAITQHTTHADGGKVVLTTTLRHVGGGKLKSKVELGQSPGNPQAFGGALTYLRRYEIVTLLGIAAEEDTDAQGIEPERRNGNGGSEVPSWAKDATDRRKREYVEALEAIIGAPRAKSLARATIDTFGTFPDVLTGFAKGLRTHFDSVQKAGGPAAEAAAAAKAEAERAEADRARAEAERAQAAAEAPDPPSPEPEAVQAVSEPEEAAPDGNEEPPPEEPAEEKPVAGSVPMPDTSKLNKTRTVATLREAGCTCKDPTLPEGDDAACPILGHGIPF